jgi:anthranilate phosphoribosyltransferase
MSTPAVAPTWASVLRTLSSRSDLDQVSVTWAMEQILDGVATPAQIGAFAMGLRAKGETPDEISALVSVMLEHCDWVPLPADLIRLDVVGTGGDLSHSVNISTMAALVAASVGAPIAKHGNRAASSSTGTADVLAELGVVIDLSPEQVAACVNGVGIGFCFAPRHHPALRHAAPVRKEVAFPTFFNILGPLANPAGAQAALIGCADPALAPALAKTLALRGVRGVVVRGDDGLDEISTATTTTVWDARTSDVKILSIDPSNWGIERVDQQLLCGGMPERNAELLLKTFRGVETSDPDADRVRAIRDSVTLNAAAALTAYDAAMGRPVEDLVEAIAARMPVAREALESGAALAVLTRWIALTQQLAAA